MIDDRAVFPVVLFAIEIPVLVASVVYWLKLLDEPPLPRDWRLRLAGFVRTTVPKLLVLVLLFGRFWTLEQIGYSTTVHWALGVLAGAIAGVLYAFTISRWSYRIFAPPISKEVAENSESESTGAERPFHAFESVLVSPIFEEVIYRGCFVFYLGTLVSPILSIPVGLIATVCLHLYYGSYRIPSIVCFYIAVTCLLYSPLGLSACIAFHITCNGVVWWMRRVVNPNKKIHGNARNQRSH